MNQRFFKNIKTIYFCAISIISCSNSAIAGETPTAKDRINAPGIATDSYPTITTIPINQEDYQESLEAIANLFAMAEQWQQQYSIQNGSIGLSTFDERPLTQENYIFVSSNGHVYTGQQTQQGENTDLLFSNTSHQIPPAILATYFSNTTPDFSEIWTNVEEGLDNPFAHDQDDDGENTELTGYYCAIKHLSIESDE